MIPNSLQVSEEFLEDKGDLGKVISMVYEVYGRCIMIYL